MIRVLCLVAALSAGLAVMFQQAGAQGGPAAAPTTVIESHALPPIVSARNDFDPQRATNAYLARISGPARTRSDAYFEGGYVLQVIDAAAAVGFCLWLLYSGWSARLRDFARARTTSKFWQAAIYAAAFVLANTIILFPLTVYEAFFREREYGLMNQTFGAWFGDFAIETGLTIAAFSLFAAGLYAAIRRAGASWWMWVAAMWIVANAVLAAAYPVFIAPLFNHYAPMPATPLRAEVLSLARANGIPAKNVYVVDASRQSDRISANVSGMFGTTRLSLNDNLLHKSSHDEILAVLGHEMGHYVMDHATRIIVLTGIVYALAFAFAHWGFGKLVRNGRWGVTGLDDPAGFPVLYLLGTVLIFLATPLNNTIIRTIEIQADMFGVNAVRKPDAFATAVLKLSTYRKLDPSPWEEFVFYDHPSGRTRIWEMMRWKAEHLHDADIAAGPASPR